MKKLLHTALVLISFSTLAFTALPALAQFEGPALDTGPWVFPTLEQDYIKVSLLARGMDHPFGFVLIPGTASAANPLGDMLLNERTGKVRLYRNGILQETPVVDLTEVFGLNQLFDIKLHPRFTENGLVYFTWIKQAPHPDGTDKLWATTAVARGRWNGEQLEDLEEVFEAQAWSADICGASSRMHFLEDETFLLGVSHRCDLESPQLLSSHIGKILRVTDEGVAPPDNPYYAVEGALPEIYTWGNRSVMDFVTHPHTGAVWELENGPQGGDEVNILIPGANYGWPLATFGRDYDGTRFNPLPYVEGTELPMVFWVPSITVAGLTFYTGDKFENWKDNLFVTSMLEGRVANTGHLERVVLNEYGELRREKILTELHQRIRYVQQGPDGLLYVLTDHSDGALLRIEPATEEEARMFSMTVAPLASGGNEAIVFEDQDCKTCHRTENSLLGPSYREIANRYDLNDGTVNALADKIIDGGTGVWGDAPMSPHPMIDQATARAMVREILAL